MLPKTPLYVIYVIPTKVGIQLFLSWIPAYAGMTRLPLSRPAKQAGLSRQGHWYLYILPKGYVKGTTP